MVFSDSLLARVAPAREHRVERMTITVVPLWIQDHSSVPSLKVL
jgi:hypothetical protein